MKTSAAGVALIKSFEQFVGHWYRCEAGVLTIGYGHTTSTRAALPGPITEAEASDLLARDLVTYERAVLNALKVPVSQSEFDAMVSLAFNIGGKAVAGSSVIRLLNAGDRPGAARAFGFWNKVTKGGRRVTSNGLAVRRKREAALFLSPDAKPAPASVKPVEPKPTRQSGATLTSPGCKLK